MPQKPLVNWPFFFDHLNENKLNNSAFTKKGNGGPDLAVLFHIYIDRSCVYLLVYAIKNFHQHC